MPAFDDPANGVRFLQHSTQGANTAAICAIVIAVADIIQQAHGEWMLQKARKVADQFSGFLKDKKYLIHDRDPLFTKEFREILRLSSGEPTAWRRLN